MDFAKQANVPIEKSYSVRSTEKPRPGSYVALNEFKIITFDRSLTSRSALSQVSSETYSAVLETLRRTGGNSDFVPGWRRKQAEQLEAIRQRRRFQLKRFNDAAQLATNGNEGQLGDIPSSPHSGTANPPAL